MLCAALVLLIAGALLCLKLYGGACSAAVTTEAPLKSAQKKPSGIAVANKKTPLPPLEQMIGQMLMLGFLGTEPEHKGVIEAKRLLDKGLIGGLIFMGRNLETKTQVKTLLSTFSHGSARALPGFFAIDQEGGKVQRLREAHGFSDVPEAGTIGADLSPAKAQQIYQTMAGELASVGFNVNFGPVVDLNLVPTNPIIGQKGRSYGGKSHNVERYARSFVLAHRQHKILTSLKHYPGHGSSWTDSHEQFVDLSKSWQPQELMPYRGLVSLGLVDMVMVGHLYHPDFSDGGKIPASLSRKAIDRLRHDIGFKGLVVTDDLGMGAIKKYFSYEETLIRAIHAGNDLLLLVDPKLASEKEMARLHKIIRGALRDKKISRQAIERAYERVVDIKQRLLMGRRAQNVAP